MKKIKHWHGPCIHCSPARDNVLFVLPSKQRSRPPFIFHNLYQTWPKCSGKVRPLSQRPCCLERERRDALISRAQNKTAEMRRVNITKISFIFQKSIFSKHYRIKNIYRFTFCPSTDWANCFERVVYSDGSIRHNWDFWVSRYWLASKCVCVCIKTQERSSFQYLHVKEKTYWTWTCLWVFGVLEKKRFKNTICYRYYLSKKKKKKIPGGWQLHVQPLHLPAESTLA